MADLHADIGAGPSQVIRDAFKQRMDDDLDVRGTFANVSAVFVMVMRILIPNEASGVAKALKEVDEALHVIF